MSLLHRLLTFGIVAAICWLSRRLPIKGLQRAVVMGARLIAVALLCIMVWTPAPRRAQERSQHVIYLADVSPSIDAQQRQWMARRIVSLEAIRPSRVQRALITFAADAQLVVPFGQEPLANPDALERLLASRLPAGQASHTNIEAA